MLSRGNARNQAHACSTMHAYKVGTVMSSLSRLVEIVDFQSIDLFMKSCTGGWGREIHAFEIEQSYYLLHH